MTTGPSLPYKQSEEQDWSGAPPSAGCRCPTGGQGTQSAFSMSRRTGCQLATPFTRSASTSRRTVCRLALLPTTQTHTQAANRVESKTTSTREVRRVLCTTEPKPPLPKLVRGSWTRLTIPAAGPSQHPSLLHLVALTSGIPPRTRYKRWVVYNNKHTITNHWQ